MARAKSSLAILMALALIFSPTTIVWADGPTQYQVGNGNTTDGHPWDDEVVESDPGTGDPNTPGEQTSQVPVDVTVVSAPTTATVGSGPHFVVQALQLVIGKWLELMEMKSSKSKSVRRLR